MKQLLFILISLTSILHISCKEKVDSEGGYLAHDLFMLDGNELVLLHEHTIDIGAEQYNTDIQIVSQGAVKIERLDQPTAISLAILTGFTGKDAIIYDYIPTDFDGETRNIPRYVQTLRITAGASAQKQTCRFRIITQNPMLECADITIRQAGAK